MARKALLRAATASAVLSLVPALAAAGDADDLSARELADRARDNLLGAESVRLEFTDRSEAARDSTRQPVSMKLALDRDGNCVGTMRLGADGGSVELVKRGEEVWMKPDGAFWKAQVPGGRGDAVAELFKNRYIHGTTRDAMLRGLAGTCDLNTFQKDVATPDAPGGTPLTKGDERTVDGTKVVPLRGEKDGRDATLYVTSDAPHRLVHATQKGAGTDITLAFKDYDEPVPSKTPAPDDTVDIGRLRDELGGA
jgi:hypothetical protein